MISAGWKIPAKHWSVCRIINHGLNTERDTGESGIQTLKGLKVVFYRRETFTKRHKTTTHDCEDAKNKHEVMKKSHKGHKTSTKLHGDSKLLK